MASFKDTLTELFTENTDLARDFMNQYDYEFEENDEFQDYRNSMSYECVDRYGGGGQGENYYSVYQFTSNDTGEQLYVKFQGWYASYVGSEYQDFSFVQPKEVTRIEYL